MRRRGCTRRSLILLAMPWMMACGMKEEVLGVPGALRTPAATGAGASADAQAVGSASSDPSYGALLKALRLNDDPARPSGLVRDVAYRAKLQAALVEDAARNACHEAEFLRTRLNQYGTREHLLRFRTAGAPEVDRFASISVPPGQDRLPLLLFAHSGYQFRYDPEEALAFLGSAFLRSVVAVPLFPGEQAGVAGAPLLVPEGRRAYHTEVDTLQGLAVCLQAKAARLETESGESLASRLVATEGIPGFRTTIAGVGRGALIAGMAIARSGAGSLAGDVDPVHWARFDCAAFGNPLSTWSGAEQRLLLEQLVKGESALTRYALIPGVRELRYEWFRPYREAKLSADSLAFEIAKRDLHILAPFLLLGLRDYAKQPDEQGPRAGTLAVFHGKRRSDFGANQSRILANILTTAAFTVGEQSNGVNLLFREYMESVEDAEDSFHRGIGGSFATAPAVKLADPYISISEDLQERAAEYRWIIRGRAFNASENLPAREVLEGVLQGSCGFPKD